MILGILDADTLREDLQPTYISYTHMFKTLFKQAVQDHEIEYVSYNVNNNEYPAHIDECDAYLITGSKSSTYDDDEWIKTLRSYIQLLFKQKKKILGICFGHQLIADSLGGKAMLSNNGWGVGVHTYSLSTNNLNSSLASLSQFSLLVSHRDQVVALPQEATVLASSDFCPFAAYQINQQVLCFQGHPEFTPPYADELMKKRQSIIPSHVFQQGQENLYLPTHHLIIAKSLLDFVLQAD
jgi:GMP synthase-like glutamine amidotransferase